MNTPLHDENARLAVCQVAAAPYSAFAFTATEDQSQVLCFTNVFDLLQLRAHLSSLWHYADQRAKELLGSEALYLQATGKEAYGHPEEVDHADISGSPGRPQGTDR